MTKEDNKTLREFSLFMLLLLTLQLKCDTWFINNNFDVLHL